MKLATLNDDKLADVAREQKTAHIVDRLAPTQQATLM